MLFEVVEGRKNSSPERFERTLHRQIIFRSEGTWTLICVFPFYFIKSQRSNFSKTLEVFGPQRAVITTVFLTLWLGGHWGCVWGRKSLNRSMRTGEIFSAPLLARNSRFALASRSSCARLFSPKIRKKLRLFCRLRCKAPSNSQLFFVTERTQLNATHAQLLKKLRPIALAETCRFLSIQSLEFQEIWQKKNTSEPTCMIYHEKSEFWHLEFLIIQKTIQGEWRKSPMSNFTRTVLREGI